MAGRLRFGFLLLLLVCGCYQRFYAIEAVETEDGLAFEFPEVEEGLSDKRKYELLDLMLTTRDCGSCRYWDIVSAPGPRNAALNAARIRYGETFPGTVIRTPARTLTAGIYTIGATVQEYGPDGEFVRSLSTMGHFEVYLDGSGKLRARSHDRSKKKGGCQ